MKKFNKSFLLVLSIAAFGLSACASMERNVAAEKAAAYHHQSPLDRL